MVMMRGRVNGQIADCKDKKGDDDVEIVIRSNGTVEVEYRSDQDGC